MAGEAWQQEQVVAGHKQREVNAGAQSTFSFLFCLQPQPLEWYHPHSEQDFHLPFSFCCRALMNRALKDIAPKGRPPMERAIMNRTLVGRALKDRALNDRALMDRTLMDKALMDITLVNRVLLDRIPMDIALMDRNLMDRTLIVRDLVDRARGVFHAGSDLVRLTRKTNHNKEVCPFPDSCHSI